MPQDLASTSICCMTLTAAYQFEIPHEFATRSADQIDVALLWWETADRLAVSVLDRKANESFVLEVDGLDPMAVFRHPYTYVPASAGALG